MTELRRYEKEFEEQIKDFFDLHCHKCTQLYKGCKASYDEIVRCMDEHFGERLQRAFDKAIKELPERQFPLWLCNVYGCFVALADGLGVTMHSTVKIIEDELEKLKKRG